MSHRKITPLLSLILLLPLTSTARAAWSNDPAVNLSIADRTSEQVVPKVASTSDGGCYVSWFDHASGNYDVYLQRLDSAGVEQWPHNGILVSDHPQNSSLVDWDLIADSADQAVLVFSDARDGSDLDIQAYRIDPSGGFTWGPDGLTLSANDDYEPSPRVAEASDGDFVFVWARLPDASDGHIMMQRVAPDGTLRFTAGGVPIAGETGESPGFCDVVPAEDGSVIVCWVRDISTFFSPRHLRAEKFSSTGASAWGAPTVVFDAYSLPIAYYPGIREDTSGGAIVWWHRSDGSMYNSFVQHLDADGNELFTHNGVAVSTVTTRHHIDPTLSYDPSSGEMRVFWNERNSAQSQWGVYGQIISAGGARLWGDSGAVLLPVNTVYKLSIRSVPYGDGAMVFLIDEPTGTFGQDQVIGMRVDGNGDMVWPGSPILISSTLSGKARLPITIDQNGTVVLIWEDDRAGTVDVYGQNVHPDGSLGAPAASSPEGGAWPVSASVENLPNPFSRSTELVIRAGFPLEGRLLLISNGAGQLVRSLPLDSRAAGRVVLTWDGADDHGRRLPAGTYFYRLSGGSGVDPVAAGPISGKAVLVR
jgi:hypothetical protein